MEKASIPWLLKQGVDGFILNLELNADSTEIEIITPKQTGQLHLENIFLLI